MTLQEAMKARHSVRSYLDQPLDEAVVDRLTEEIQSCNRDSGLHIQLIRNEPRAFSSPLAHYGLFSNVKSYLVLAGPDTAQLDERCGYYGQHLVLLAQQLGLNTCWVAGTYRKIYDAFQLERGEKLCCVIAIGYGASQGKPRRSKLPEQVARFLPDSPDWFRRGVDAALLAPTAINQQQFHFSHQGNVVTAKPGLGFCSRIDLGIVKYQFELGAGKDQFIWA
ncbi:MAG: nitroreductase family protein [Oscillospiraceae bacterium]|nr:nitroreductase family protein [Oscillospiraceae bacterium]